MPRSFRAGRHGLRQRQRARRRQLRVVPVLGGIDDALEEDAGDRDHDAREQEPGDDGGAQAAQHLEGAVEPALAGVRKPSSPAPRRRRTRATKRRQRQTDAQPEHAAHAAVAQHGEGAHKVLQHRWPVPRRSGTAGWLRGVLAAAIVAHAATAKRSSSMHLADTGNDRHDVLGIGNAIVDILAYAEDDLVAELGLARGRHDADRRGAQRLPLSPSRARARGLGRLLRQHHRRRGLARRPRRLYRPRARRPAGPGVRPRHPRRRRHLPQPAQPDRPVDRHQHDLRHPRRPAHHEHLSRRLRRARPRRCATPSSWPAPSITYLEGYLWDRPEAKAACRKAADDLPRGRQASWRSPCPTASASTAGAASSAS